MCYSGHRGRSGYGKQGPIALPRSSKRTTINAAGSPLTAAQLSGTTIGATRLENELGHLTPGGSIKDRPVESSEAIAKEASMRWVQEDMNDVSIVAHSETDARFLKYND
jgi:hypothetical protein